MSLKSLLTTLLDELKRKAIYWHYPHYHSEGATPYSAMRMGNWKLIHVMETNKYELYDLKNDISESKNLYDKEPEIAKKLIKSLEEWRKKMGHRCQPLKNKIQIEQID